jgi:PKD repeat protein
LIANGYNVAAIGYHGSDQFNNIYANARRSYYGVTGNPTAFFDGGNAQVGGIPSGSMYSYYTGPTAAAAAIPCNFELEIYGTANGSNYDIMAVIRMVEPYTGSNLVFHLAVTESDIPYTWYNQTEVNHVCRLMVPDANGTALDFSSTDEIVLNLSYTLDPTWVASHCDLVPFVQNNTSKAVLQGIEVPLMFLPPPPPPLAAGFSSDLTSVCETNQVQFYDESTGNPSAWEWTFEGGDPATSNEQDPLVTYNTPGVYDVTLTVTKGSEDSTMVSEEYMTVYAYPDQPTVTQEGDDLVSSSEEGNQWYYEGDIIPDATAQVYTPTQGGNYSVMVTINGCGSMSEEFYFSWVGIDEQFSQKELTVFPSPSTGSFTVNLNTGNAQSIDLKVLNATNAVVYEEEGIHINGKYQRTLELNNLPNGMYFLVIEGLEDVYVQKIIIQK